MSSRSDGSKHTAVPDSCDKCQFTTCFVLHTSTTSSCPYKLCPECRELEILDAQIADAHNHLITLSQKRHALKGRINRRHDPLTSHLPLEIISYIFNLITSEPRCHKSYSDNAWNPVVLIGAVCKRWRDITLGTPQLWAEVVINPWEHAASLEITEQWLSRSCSLPLSLSVDTSEDKHLPSELPPNTSNLFQLLRSQASRWKDLTLIISIGMLQNLLNGMEYRAPVDSLTISVNSAFTVTVGIDNITMEYPFVPKTLDISYIPVPLIPVHWDRLTHLTTYSIEVDDLLYIFRSAPNLRDCNLDIPSRPGETVHYPIPVSPPINDSVTRLNIQMADDDDSGTIHFIQHLTLPSLESLSYSVTYTVNREELDALIDFFDRSRPPLHKFSLFLHDSRPPGPFEIDWYRSLSSITSLDLAISIDDGERLQAYIQGLKADLRPMGLPCLQHLEIHAPMMNPQTWDALAEIFTKNANRNDAENASPAVSRPLKTVKIYIRFCWEDREIMRRSTFYRLRNIRESGVRLMVFDEDRTDLLDPFLEEDCLKFCESDDNDSDEFEGSSETGGSEDWA